MTKGQSSLSRLPTQPRDPDRPSTWAPYTDGLCQGCQALCCRLPVEVTTEDLIHLGLLTAEECRGSLRQVARRLETTGVIQAYLEKSKSFILAQTSEGFCRYLGPDRRCSVYEKRPEVCRSFPKIGPRPGFCPANPVKARIRRAEP